MKKLTILLLCTGCCLQLAAQNDLTTAIDKIIKEQYKPGKPGGVILVASKGKVIYKKPYGMGNLELNVPTNDSMVYWIGSNTKQFTAVCILQLAEQGKLQLSDTLGKYLTTAPTPASGITLRQLLSHTSGLTEKTEGNLRQLIKGETITRPTPVDVPPGTKWEYNNTNFDLLGYIIEKLTGQKYKDYVTQHIFQPLGMIHSYVDETKLVIPNRAPGYDEDKVNAFRVEPEGNYAAPGGILSTVEDMLLWRNALKTDKLLKQQTLQQAFQPQKLNDGKLVEYGLGWHLQTLRGSVTQRHGGRTPGYISETLYLPKEDVYVVILTNTSNQSFPIIAITRMIAALAINKPFVFEAVAINANELKKYEGVYENSFHEMVNIVLKNDKLVFQRPNGKAFDLSYSGNNEFFLGNDLVRVHFTPGDKNAIKSLRLAKLDMSNLDWNKTDKPLLNLSPDGKPL